MRDHMNFEKQDVEIEEWSDKRCINISLQDNFPAIVTDIKVQKNVISRFLNFYLGGKIQKGLNAKDLLFAVIAIMPASLDSETFIWDDSYYTEEGSLFFLTPDDKLKVEIGIALNKRINEKSEDKTDETDKINIEVVDDAHSGVNKNGSNQDNGSYTSEILYNINADNTETTTVQEQVFEQKYSNKVEIETPQIDQDPSPAWNEIRWFRNKRELSSKINVATEIVDKIYGPVENAEFCISCNKLLGQWETNVRARNSLKYFFAMAALVSMRGKVKTIQYLIKYFSNTFSSHLFPNQINSYTPPQKSFVKKCWKAIRETDIKTQIMFAKLVVTSFRSERLKNYSKSNILQFAVLSHTANYKMGLISMLQLVASKVYEFKILFRSLYNTETAVSWNRVNDFINKYMCTEAKQYTHHWACLVENDQFQYLSCSNNYVFAVVIAVFIEKLTKESGIWRSAWVSTGKHLDSSKQVGIQIYSDYKKKQSSYWFEATQQCFIE